MPVTNLSCVDKLVEIGLNKYEALAYLALLEENNAAAIDIANRSGVPKQRIYDVLDNLQTKGLCSVQEGRPRFYIAYPPQQALPALLNYRKRRQATENERQARLIQELIPSLGTVTNGENGKHMSLEDGELSLPAQEVDHVDAYRDIGGF
jgi:sugar-specific transcriptional regulator TrmB